MPFHLDGFIVDVEILNKLIKYINACFFRSTFIELILPTFLSTNSLAEADHASMQ